MIFLKSIGFHSNHMDSTEIIMIPITSVGSFKNLMDSIEIVRLYVNHNIISKYIDSTSNCQIILIPKHIKNKITNNECIFENVYL